MYDLRQVRRALTRRKLLLRELNRLYHTRGNRRAYNPDGVDVLAEDWDNLLILDACRYDAFAARADLPGRLERRRSRGSHTSEFFVGNFHGRDLLDTVYVTGSMMAYRDRTHGEIEVTFHREIDVWRDDGWDEELDTVRPETMVTYAEQAAAASPNKRLIVHFLQPHFPAIGATGRNHPAFNSLDVWGAVDTGEVGVPDAVLRRAYHENLDALLLSVEDLMETLSGKTVVTADHGQMIGERSFPIPFHEHGHPPGIYTQELLSVPWLVHTNGPRREITAEELPTREQADDGDETVVSERLRHLGYRD